MNIVIYESSSRGGNYNYAFELLGAYRSVSGPSSVELMIPSNSNFASQKGVRPKLLPDDTTESKWRNKFSFIVRTLFSPMVLFFHLFGKKRALVIFNDFEQSSAPFWTLLFRVFLRQHRYAVVLHDPDRDQYPPSLSYARFSMRALMKLMDLALYHDHLPDKPYYKALDTKFISIPHGIYSLPAPDKELSAAIETFKNSSPLFAIVGNIRKEKNYELAIMALKSFPQAKLVIAGKPANAGMDVRVLQELAEKNGLEKSILWVIRYLSDAELASVIQLSDCILLNYAATFTSQSGVISMIAPYKKRIIVSNTQSSMTKLTKKFSLGTIIQADDLNALTKAMEQVMQNRDTPTAQWENFLEFASWTNHVTLVTEAYERL